MINWLARFFRPKTLYLVYNEEEHVGSFFQAAFYDYDEAAEYIAGRLVQAEREMMDLAAHMEEEVAAGNYPAELYDPTRMVLNMKMSIEEYTPSTAKKMLEPSVK